MFEQAWTRCRASSQGASGKRANGDFPSRGWKIVIGRFDHCGRTWRNLRAQSRELSELRRTIKFYLYIYQHTEASISFIDQSINQPISSINSFICTIWQLWARSADSRSYSSYNSIIWRNSTLSSDSDRNPTSIVTGQPWSNSISIPICLSVRWRYWRVH